MEALGRCRILGMLGDRLTALSGARQRPRMEKTDTDFITTVIRLSTTDPSGWCSLIKRFPTLQSTEPIVIWTDRSTC